MMMKNEIEKLKNSPKIKKQPEFLLQKQICQYLKNQYPKVIFLSDTIAIVKLTAPQALRNKKIQKSNFKIPDLLILEPKKEFHGLFIELKKETPFKKNGEIKASQNDHLKKQLKSIEDLKNKGYNAQFSWSFEMTKKIIDNYLN